MKKITLLLFVFVNAISIAQNHSLNFDGVDDFVDLEQNFAFEATDSFTIEAWINARTNSSTQQIIAKLGSGNESYRGWGFQMTSDGFLSAFVSTEFFTQTRYVEGVQVLEADVWYHVAMSFDGQDEVLLYINGESESFSFTDYEGELTTIATDAPTHIGNFDDGNAQEHFFGNIDELRIWEGVRTPEEITANYMTELSGNETNLLGYYKMDATNSSCDVQDCNANEAHGSRQGANGANDLPQFSNNVPELTDVECGVTLDCTLSVEDVAQLEFSIFPNPTSNTISFSGINLIGEKVKLYTVLGSLSKELLVVDNTIDISEVPAGVYFMVVILENTKVSKKIIKQ